MIATSIAVANPNDVRVYAPGLDQSAWDASPADKLVCRLSQTIPYFGKVEFVRHAGKAVTLVIHAERGPYVEGRAELISRPPDWNPGPATKPIAVLKVFPGNRPIVLSPMQTRTVLAELERGWVPTISFHDWDGTNDQIFVSILPVDFREGITNYYTCQQQLLPFGFDDIKHTVIYFGPDGITLDSKAREALKRVAQYISVDPSVNDVKLSGYSDSQDNKKESYELSIERLKTVQTFLFGQGVPFDEIDSTAFGERDPLGDNSTAWGRAQNRRVVLDLTKD